MDEQQEPFAGTGPAEPSAIFDWPVDFPVHEAIEQAIGAASQCWEHPEALVAAGAYDSDLAGRIADELLALLQSKLWAT